MYEEADGLPYETRFAWLPVHAEAPLNGSKKAGWVWLRTVEKVSDGFYRKLPLGKLDTFGLRQSPVFPTLASDPIQPKVSGMFCDCATCKATRAEKAAKLSGDADQFGGPRRIKNGLHEEIADKAVTRFIEQTTTDQGTPLFRRSGPTADTLKVILIEAMFEATWR